MAKHGCCCLTMEHVATYVATYVGTDRRYVETCPGRTCANTQRVLTHVIKYLVCIITWQSMGADVWPWNMSRHMSRHMSRANMCKYTTCIDTRNKILGLYYHLAKHGCWCLTMEYVTTYVSTYAATYDGTDTRCVTTCHKLFWYEQWICCAL